jgi:hypothetical protein
MLLVVWLLFLSGCNYEDEEEVKEYLKDKYGIDVVVTEWGGVHSGNMGHTYHTVQVADNKNIQFRVEVNGFFYSRIQGDEYEYGINTYEEYERFKPVLEEIEQLGYSELEEENVIQYLSEDGPSTEEKPTNKLLLSLKTSNKIDYSQFESDELNRLFSVLQLVQKNNKNITELTISDYNGGYTGLSFSNIQEINTKEELLLLMKDDSLPYWTYLVQTQTKIQEKIKEVQDERFVLKEITCSYIKNGDCLEYELILEFSDDMLDYEKNPNLAGDLTKVATIAKEELSNKEFSLHLKSEEGSEDYGHMIFSEDMHQSNSIEEYMKERILRLASVTKQEGNEH